MSYHTETIMECIREYHLHKVNSCTPQKHSLCQLLSLSHEPFLQSQLILHRKQSLSQSQTQIPAIYMQAFLSSSTSLSLVTTLPEPSTL